MAHNVGEDTEGETQGETKGEMQGCADSRETAVRVMTKKLQGARQGERGVTQRVRQTEGETLCRGKYEERERGARTKGEREESEEENEERKRGGQRRRDGRGEHRRKTEKESQKQERV
jgi:hypothetical protein